MKDNNTLTIPDNSKAYEQLVEMTENAQLVVFSGLPGVGKSLYVNSCMHILRGRGLKTSLIQWDVARKAFEIDYVMSRYPMSDGMVHNGLKIMAGLWLLDYINNWNSTKADDEVLLIEAPLIGHRFAELVHHQKDREMEKLLSSSGTIFIVPIPTRAVRKKIEEERRRQVSEDAKDWSGAKPSVMLQLWKDTCEIANEFGMDIDLSEQPPYSDGIYEFVYSVILRHRNFEALIVDELFDLPEKDESALHSHEGIGPDEEQASHYAQLTSENYSDQRIDEIVSQWYKT